MPGPVWELEFPLLSECATDCWLKTVWKYCWDNHLTLSDPTPELPLRRIRDKHIMHQFVQSRKYSKSELRKLNVCRCFLKATTLADVCSADGKNITSQALDGIPTETAVDAPSWPRQPSSLKADYALAVVATSPRRMLRQEHHPGGTVAATGEMAERPHTARSLAVQPGIYRTLPPRRNPMENLRKQTRHCTNGIPVPKNGPLSTRHTCPRHLRIGLHHTHVPLSRKSHVGLHLRTTRHPNSSRRRTP